MATSTMDNASAQLAIALQLRDLDELEASGTIDNFVIRVQRQQLEIDSGFDAVAFEDSRRLALSMAKAVEDDAVLLTGSTRLPRIDNAVFERLALLNHAAPSSLNGDGVALQRKGADGRLPLKAEGKKRVRSVTPEDGPSSEHLHKKVRGEQTLSGQHPCVQVENSEVSSVQGPQPSTADVSDEQIIKEKALTTAIETPPSAADCASCSDHSTTDNLVKAFCEHYYCKDCFGHFVEASLQTHDGFPPKCCKIPIAFITIAENVSTEVFSRYSARQAEIKNATALCCGIQGCGVKIEKDRIDGVRATCMSCWRDTCTLCCGELPRRVDGKKVVHVCKKDEAREQVLALAKQEGWQTCYQCGNLIALNFGCHHMSCRCKAEFCYRCGTKWRNCNCGDYDELHLDIRAARGVRIRAARRAAQNRPLDPRPYEQQVAELQQRLQVGCDHNNFNYEGGKSRKNPGYCEICEYRGWKYIFRCTNCRFTACRECHNFLHWNGGDNPQQDLFFGRRHGDDDTDDDTDDTLVSEADSN